MRESNPIIRFENNPTRKNAIAAKCAGCMGCTRTHQEVGYRVSISHCSDKDCPLHRFRPYRA